MYSMIGDISSQHHAFNDWNQGLKGGDTELSPLGSQQGCGNRVGAVTFFLCPPSDFPQQVKSIFVGLNYDMSHKNATLSISLIDALLFNNQQYAF